MHPLVALRNEASDLLRRAAEALGHAGPLPPFESPPDPAMGDLGMPCFTLAKAQDVTVRIYNVAGREVAAFTKKAVEGPNSIIWDGSMSNGAKATAGVYFYAIDGIDFVKDSSKAQKMILLGANTQ